MLDIGSWEVMVIVVAALLVVGPAKFPGLARTVGQWVGKARRMARDFQRSLEDAARDADVPELKQTADAVRRAKGATSPTAWLDKSLGPDDGFDDDETPPAKPAAPKSDAPKPEAPKAAAEAPAKPESSVSAASAKPAETATPPRSEPDAAS